MSEQQLLRRAWDALDSFKQAYPENWSEDDEQVMADLMRADMKISGVQLKWVELTQREIDDLYCEHHDEYGYQLSATGYERAIEAKLKEKNNAT